MGTESTVKTLRRLEILRLSQTRHGYHFERRGDIYLSYEVYMERGKQYILELFTLLPSLHTIEVINVEGGRQKFIRLSNDRGISYQRLNSGRAEELDWDGVDRIFGE
jgi:hypothetical protein